MTKRVFLLISAISMAVASAASNVNVNLYQPTTVNGTTFKTGEAKFEVNGNKVVLKQGQRGSCGEGGIQQHQVQLHQHRLQRRRRP
jgi:hypothetical protein